MAVNFSNLKKDIHLKIQDKQTPNKALIIILLKTKDRKKKNIKTARENDALLFTADFSSEILDAKRKVEKHL